MTTVAGTVGWGYQSGNQSRDGQIWNINPEFLIHRLKTEQINPEIGFNPENEPKPLLNVLPNPLTRKFFSRSLGSRVRSVGFLLISLETRVLNPKSGQTSHNTTSVPQHFKRVKPKQQLRFSKRNNATLFKPKCELTLCWCVDSCIGASILCWCVDVLMCWCVDALMRWWRRVNALMCWRAELTVL
jgi:hypothetical protein